MRRAVFPNKTLVFYNVEVLFIFSSFSYIWSSTFKVVISVCCILAIYFISF